MRHALIALVLAISTVAVWRFTTAVVPLPHDRPGSQGGRLHVATSAAPLPANGPIPAARAPGRVFDAPGVEMRTLDQPDMSGPPIGSPIVQTSAGKRVADAVDGPPTDATSSPCPADPDTIHKTK